MWENVELHNVVETIEPQDGEGVLLSRIPNAVRESLNDSAKRSALCAAGCEIRLNIKGPEVKVTLMSDEKSHGLLEVFQGNYLISWLPIGPKPTQVTLTPPQNMGLLEAVTKEQNLPFDPRLTRVVLPYIPAIRLIDIEGETSPPKPEQTPEEKLLTYGSSITHGAMAIRPTGSYAMRIAQRLGVDLINLGLGGGAHCEPQITD